jgi:hypothetical protein
MILFGHCDKSGKQIRVNTEQLFRNRSYFRHMLCSSNIFQHFSIALSCVLLPQGLTIASDISQVRTLTSKVVK